MAKGGIPLDKVRRRPLRWDRQSSLYYRACGQALTASGKMRPKTFWLGKDADVAKTRIKEIELAWSKLQTKGYTTWTEETLIDLQVRGICTLRKTIMRLPKGYHDKVVPIIQVDPKTLKKRDEIRHWFSDDGKVKPEHFVDFQKYAITDLLNCDHNTVTLLEQIQHLWNNDSLGTLERIARLGIAPNTLNLGIVKINTATPIAFDASEPSTAIVDDPTKIIDIDHLGD